MQVAPNQISPGEPFDVFYFLRNPLDATTYYVRAKIYDVRTGELLDTIALEQSPTNSRLFIKTVQAPPDPVGYGRNIVAIASVYTDSGFTTQSDSYEEQEQYYLIKAVQALGGGGGIDYRAVREMMEEIVGKKLSSLPKPVPPEPVPYDALFGAIGALQRELNRVPKEFDMSEVNARLGAIQRAIGAIPEPEQPDLTVLGHLSSKMGTLEFDLQAVAERLDAQATAASNALSAAVRNLLPEIQNTLEKGLLPQIEKHIQTFIGGQELSIPIASLMRPTKRVQSDETVDVSHLMKR